MEEVTLRDLDSRLQKQVENARKSLDKNPTYAVDVLMNIVNRNPSCLEARKILRQAQKKSSLGKTKGLGGLLNKVTSIPFAMKSDAKVQKDPAKAMETAEDLLKANPDNVAGHKLLGAGALALEMYGTAAFAFEAIYKIDPNNGDNVVALMNAYIDMGEGEQAIRIGEVAYRKNPANDEVQRLIKKASVQQTVEKGKWEEDKSFRDKLKDEEEAQKLELANRAQTGEAGLRKLIEEATAGVEAEPGNMNNYRDLANYYRKLEEYDNAIKWVQAARELEAGRADVNLERLEGTLLREKMNAAVKVAEEALEANPEDASAKAALEELREQEQTFRKTQAEALVQRYPNEFGYRYELGDIYLAEGNLDGAIKELQLALRSPKVRLNALVKLGQAYKNKTFYDLAAEQFLAAKSEISGVTDLKKEVLYELGSCYELQGDMDKAMAEFKALYGADIAYRDVSQKIDDFYTKRSS